MPGALASLFFASNCHVIACIYIAVGHDDARFTRICVASVRYFYPDIPIHLLVCTRVNAKLLNELHSLWNVDTADLPRVEYGFF